MNKVAWFLTVVGAMVMPSGGSVALAVEQAVQAIGASPSQLAEYTILGQVIDGSGIRIADIDTEIDLEHPALAGAITSYADYSGEGLLDPDTEFHPFLAKSGQRVWVNDLHATAVVGTMVSNGLDSDDNQTGHIGISPGATVDVAKFWESNLDKNTDGAIVAAFEYATSSVSVIVIEDQTNDRYALGNSTFTTAVDHLASVYDTLIVQAAGNNGPDNPAFSVPADAYNGLTVGATDATYSKVAEFSNRGPTDEADGGRAKPDLVAPGVGLVLPFGGWEDDDGRDGSAAVNYKNPSVPADVTQFMAPNITSEQDIDADWVTVSGTSFSAPLVAGAGALLQQWGGYRGMDTSSKTLRAVMVNSTNKIDGALGMTRTITDREDLNWLSSEAYTSDTIPLDDQMGSGQIDVSRALEQYDAGEQGPGAVANIGWDQHAALTEGEYVDYAFDTLLTAGDYISATLVWDRPVFAVDNGEVGVYEPGLDGFFGLPLDNMDLYLMRSDDSLAEEAVWRSISEVDNLEHIFWQIAEPGAYKLRVVLTEDITFAPGFESTPDFSLAWWAGVPEPASGMLLAAAGLLGLLRRP